MWGKPPRINVSVHPSGIWKHIDFECRNKNQGVHVEFSVHCLSPLNTYSYVREENSGSTRKFVENHLLFTCTTNKILALCTIHPQSIDGLEKLFSDSRKKFLQPTRSGCLNSGQLGVPYYKSGNSWEFFSWRTSWPVPIYFHQFLLALPAITYLQKRYERKVKVVIFITLSLLASFYVCTFFVDRLSWAKLAKIGENS